MLAKLITLEQDQRYYREEKITTKTGENIFNTNTKKNCAGFLNIPNNYLTDKKYIQQKIRFIAILLDEWIHYHQKLCSRFLVKCSCSLTKSTIFLNPPPPVNLYFTRHSYESNTK